MSLGIVLRYGYAQGVEFPDLLVRLDIVASFEERLVAVFSDDFGHVIGLGYAHHALFHELFAEARREVSQESFSLRVHVHVVVFTAEGLNICAYKSHGICFEAKGVVFILTLLTG